MTTAGPAAALALVLVAGAVAVGLWARRWQAARVARWHAEDEAERKEWVALRTYDEELTVAQAAAKVGRAPSTIHGWLSSGKLRRVDPGGKGVAARVMLMDVLRAELAVRGKGRPPATP